MVHGSCVHASLKEQTIQALGYHGYIVSQRNFKTNECTHYITLLDHFQIQFQLYYCLHLLLHPLPINVHHTMHSLFLGPIFCFHNFEHYTAIICGCYFISTLNNNKFPISKQYLLLGSKSKSQWFMMIYMKPHNESIIFYEDLSFQTILDKDSHY